jgi:hypothetical protein
MDQVLQYNPQDFDVTVQPGVTRKTLNHHIKDDGKSILSYFFVMRLEIVFLKTRELYILLYSIKNGQVCQQATNYIRALATLTLL